MLAHYQGDDPPRIERLATGGAVLGLITPGSYSTQTVRALPGDVIVLMSDGITEAPNRRGEQFGEDRLIQVIASTATLPAAAIRDAILSAVSSFTGERLSPDDQTLLVVRLWGEEQ